MKYKARIIKVRLYRRDTGSLEEGPALTDRINEAVQEEGEGAEVVSVSDGTPIGDIGDCKRYTLLLKLP